MKGMFITISDPNNDDYDDDNNTNDNTNDNNDDDIDDDNDNDNNNNTTISTNTSTNNEITKNESPYTYLKLLTSRKTWWSLILSLTIWSNCALFSRHLGCHLGRHLPILAGWYRVISHRRLIASNVEARLLRRYLYMWVLCLSMMDM